MSQNSRKIGGLGENSNRRCDTGWEQNNTPYEVQRLSSLQMGFLPVWNLVFSPLLKACHRMNEQNLSCDIPFTFAYRGDDGPLAFRGKGSSDLIPGQD